MSDDFEFPPSPGENRSATPDSRVYVHDRCGAGTEISGNDFTRIANPFAIVTGTVCARCGNVSLGSIAWADTGERISDYRRRLRSSAPILHHLVGWLVSPALGIGLGAYIGSFFTSKKFEIAPQVGGLLGSILFVSFVTPYLLLLLGGDYRRHR